MQSGMPTYTRNIDQVNAQERVTKLFSRSIKKESKIVALNTVLSMIDLTTLEGKDSQGKVKQLCYKAAHLHDQFSNLPNVAAICVYPPMVPVAKKALNGTGINVASVATAFPSGMTSLDTKLEEVKTVVAAGADEVDMVISRGKFLQGEYDWVSDEIAKVKEACGEAHLKVILESGELVTLDNVRLASDLAMAAGADFIKTSTGKVSPAATPSVVLIMLEAIRDFYKQTGNAKNVFSPFSRFHLRPNIVISFPSGFDGQVHICFFCFSHIGYFFFIGRIDRLKIFAPNARNKFPTDK